MSLGGWAIGEDLFNWIRENVEVGGHIIEFGSGDGTAHLVEYYEVISIEHNEAWINHVEGSKYIHAPISNGWYNWDALEALEYEYCDLILIDGPPESIGRQGILEYYDYNPELFHGCFVVMDDTNRVNEAKLVDAFVSKGFDIVKESVKDSEGKQFTVLRRPIEW